MGDTAEMFVVEVSLWLTEDNLSAGSPVQGLQMNPQVELFVYILGPFSIYVSGCA